MFDKSIKAEMYTNFFIDKGYRIKHSLSRSLFLLVFLFLPSLLFSLDVKPGPSFIDLSWDAVEDAVYYDIYIDKVFMARITDGSTSYCIRNLDYNTKYSIQFAARNEKNENLSASFADTETTNWDGTYCWLNTTDDDNDGKMKEIVFTVRTLEDPLYGQYLEINSIQDGTDIRIFPLFNLSDPVSGWIEYDDDSLQALCYRMNAERFNTSSIKPSRWRVSRVVMLKDEITATIETKAFGLTFSTDTTYTFEIDEDGRKVLSFSTDGAKVVTGFIFKNPNSDSKSGEFILLEKQEKI